MLNPVVIKGMNELGIRIPNQDLATFHTIDDIIAYIDRKKAA